MKTGLAQLKIVLCGPRDVGREVRIAQDAVEEWNRNHGESRKLLLRSQHWSTDSHPDMTERPQGVINRQVIDDADVIVAIFWSRFGTSTGVAGSGTEEEIRRGITLRRKVMVYFSDLEAINAVIEQTQVDRLSSFRREFMDKGLCWRFSSRDQFRRDFTGHLARVVDELAPIPQPITKDRPSQKIVGNNNVQAGGNVNFYPKPPTIKNVATPPAGSVSTSELKRIKDWIEELAEGTIGIARPDAYKKWTGKFKNTFEITKLEYFQSGRMEEAKQWFVQERGIQKRGLKTKAPDLWRNERIKAIKAAMNGMGVTNETYYPKVSERLKMKKAFQSLKNLTKRDLDRVYRMALSDSRG